MEMLTDVFLDETVFRLVNVGGSLLGMLAVVWWIAARGSLSKH
jgi:hypothetical protein